MKIREYENYNAYINHQIVKTKAVRDGTCIELGSAWDRTKMFLRIFHRDRRYIPAGADALCLCARRGEEAHALRLMGLFARGVDLVPFPPLVQRGDVHNLPFNNDSMGFVFTNSLDHFLKPCVVANEIMRVLRPNGRAMFHLPLGAWSNESSCGIEDSREVIDLFPGAIVLADHATPVYGGGMNHLLVLEM